LKLAKDDALKYLDDLFQKNAGTLHNHSEIEAISTLKALIAEGTEKVPCDSVSLQDIMALMLNQMVPKYRVSSMDSKGRNLMTYYKLQEQFEELQPEIKKRLRSLCIQVVKKVRESPHY
tara:strand:+ start:819 stop:1175 length:357 start_codon:yes stop_codon:yes gene_type:complete